MHLRRPHPIAFIAAALALVALAAGSPVRALNALSASNTYQLTDNLAYGPEARQRLDVYRPTSPAPAGGWPVVVFFYGGSWNHGERADYRFVAEALASRGVLVWVPDYRLYPEVRYPDFVQDSARAVAHALGQAASLGGNPKRVFVMGHSAGGYNAAMVALDARWLATHGHSPTELAGWVGLAAPYDFLPIANPDVQPVFHHPHSPRDSQPVEHASARSPRAFLAAPINDTLVNPERNTEGMAQRLQAAGVPVTLKRYARVNHMTLVGAFGRPLRWMAPVLDDVAAFVGRPPVELSR